MFSKWWFFLEPSTTDRPKVVKVKAFNRDSAIIKLARYHTGRKSLTKQEAWSELKKLDIKIIPVVETR